MELNTNHINKKALRDYRKKGEFLYGEKAYITDDNKYCVFFYNISEVRMMTYFCTFAVYNGNHLDAPLTAMKPNQFRTWYTLNSPFIYGPLSDCIITVYGLDMEHFGVNGMPYLLIKPSEKKFALLPFDFTSIYYDLKEKSKDLFEISEMYPQELDRCEATGKHKRQTGRFVQLNELNWYPVSKIKDIEKICKHTKI